MKRPCILTQMEMKDFPYYDYKSDSDKPKGSNKNWLDKYKNRYNKQ